MTAARSRRLVVCLALSGLALSWCALAASTPWLHRGGHDDAALAARLLMSVVCHQIPSRSFVIGGAPLAVCARCTGLYAGFLAGCLISLGLVLARRTVPGFPPRRLLLVAAFPLAAEWALGHTGLMHSSIWGRAATGVLFGCVVAFFFLPAVDEMCGELFAESRRRAASRRRKHAAAT